MAGHKSARAENNGRRRSATRHAPIAGVFLEPPQTTALDLVDHLLNQGVTLTGDVTLGVAGIDLIYLRLSALLCAMDRVMPKPRARPDVRAARAGARADVRPRAKARRPQRGRTGS